MSPITPKTPLEDLKDLVQFTGRELSGYAFPIDRHRTRKGIVFQYMGAAHGLIDPIVTTLEKKQTTAATILLRTLFEMYVRLIYLFAGKGQENVVKGVRESFRSKITGTQEWNRFLIANPHFKKGFDIDGLNNQIPVWQSYQSKTEQIFQKRYGHTNFRWPNLKQQVEAIDAWNISKNPRKRKPNDLTWIYLTIYNYWSLPAHGTFDGLNRMMEQIEGGYNLMIDGDPNDVEKIAVTAYAFYFKFVDVFSQQFGTPQRHLLTPYREKLKEFAKKK